MTYLLIVSPIIHTFFSHSHLLPTFTLIRHQPSVCLHPSVFKGRRRVYVVDLVTFHSNKYLVFDGRGGLHRFWKLKKVKWDLLNKPRMYICQSE